MANKIIIDHMDAEEFLAMHEDATNQSNPTSYLNTTQIIKNIAEDFKVLCKMEERRKKMENNRIGGYRHNKTKQIIAS